MEIIPILKHPLIEQIKNSDICELDKIKAMQGISKMILDKNYANSVMWSPGSWDLIRSFAWNRTDEGNDFWLQKIYYKMK